MNEQKNGAKICRRINYLKGSVTCALTIERLERRLFSTCQNALQTIIHQWWCHQSRFMCLPSSFYFDGGVLRSIGLKFSDCRISSNKFQPNTQILNYTMNSQQKLILIQQ